MEQLTEQQAKMVIEYFAQQAAEDAPEGEELADSHLWKTRYQASIALDRRIGAWWWESLVGRQMDLQSFDRDPDGYMHAVDADCTKETMHEHLRQRVSWSIDKCFNTSGE